MPSAETLVDDLYAGRVLGIGTRPPERDSNATSVISATHKIRYLVGHVKIRFANNRVHFDSADESFDFDGAYVWFQDGWATAGTLDHRRKILVSGMFSGCAWTIFRAPQQLGSGRQYPVFKGLHIAREGEDLQANVNLVNQYANTEGWTKIHEVASIDAFRDKHEVIMVTQLFVNLRIDTVRIVINSQGIIVQKDKTSTPIN